MLARVLGARGLEVVATREPGGTPLGERLRALLLEPGGEPPSLAAEAALFAAARAELVAKVVRPALARGAWVVSDRFLDSSLAYQGHARGLGIDPVLALNAPGVGDCLPHLSVVIDTPLATAAGRRCATPDRIEAEGAALQQRVREGYVALAGRFPERVRLLPATGDTGEVHAEVMRLIDALP